jgi:hypothetical protein
LNAPKAGRNARAGFSTGRNARPQFLLRKSGQAAVGVAHHDDLVDVEQVMRHGKRAQHVVRYQAARVAQDVRIARAQVQRLFDQHARVHACHDGQPFGRHQRQVARIGAGADVRRGGGADEGLDLRLRLSWWRLRDLPPGLGDGPFQFAPQIIQQSCHGLVYLRMAGRRERSGPVRSSLPCRVLV